MFDTALIESAHPAGDGCRTRSLPFALGLHTAVLAALVVSALWSTNDPPEPALAPVFPVFLGAPPPPKGGDAPARARPERPAVPEPRIAAPPTTMPDLPASTSEVPAEKGPTGEVGDGAPGNPDGVPNGAGTVPTEHPGIGDPDEILVPGVNGVVPPTIIRQLEPEYPEAARRLRMEGVAILRAVITASGTVDEVRVVKSAGPLLDAAAASAVRRWLYQPATREGRAVAVYLDVTVTFGLR